MTNLGCEMLFGQQYGREMQDVMERATGMSCPCKRGQVCPLIDCKPDELLWPRVRRAS